MALDVVGAGGFGEGALAGHGEVRDLQPAEDDGDVIEFFSLDEDIAASDTRGGVVPFGFEVEAGIESAGDVIFELEGPEVDVLHIKAEGIGAGAFVGEVDIEL